MEKRIYKCNICNKRLSKNGDICVNCFNDISKYERNNYENNEILNNITNEQLEKISNKYEKFTLKKVGKNKEKVIVFERKYNYLRDNLFLNFEYTFILFLVGFYMFTTFYNTTKNWIVTIPILLIYMCLVYVKHLFIKNNIEQNKLYLFKDRLVQNNAYLFKSKKEFEYIKIEDIRKDKKLFNKNELIIYNRNENSVPSFKNIITVRNVYNLDNLISVILEITKYKPEKTEDTTKDILKSSINSFKQQLELLNKNKETVNSKKRKK